ncbi:hypothetical protein H7200_00965 [Candidatus Saccharibacteria bacterium]|nr:hypothetical protein [Candidatus Saccharibacteria bacterium]
MIAHVKKISIYMLFAVMVGIFLAIALPRFVAAEAGSGGGGGFDGCSRFNYSTCTGAVWRYYKSNSNAYDIPNVGNQGVTTVTGCATTGGFFAYVLVNKNAPSDPGRVRSWKIGPVDNDPGNRSIFFGGWTNYRVLSNPSDPIPSNPQNGDYSWYSVEKAFAQTKARGQNSGYEWNGSSLLGWFCYQGLDYDLTPTIGGTPNYTDGDSTGADRARLTPAVNNRGSTSTGPDIQWRVVNFRIAPGGGVPGGGTNGNAPEQHFGNGAIAIASGAGRTFPQNVTNIAVADQVIGDYPIGTRICYALSVQPVTQNYGGWRHSAPFCVIIAKSPKFQVRGGDIRVGNNFIDQTVTAGSNITTSQTVKNR